MKKHLILAGVFTMAIVQVQPTFAVTKCVALNSNTTCTYKNPGDYVVDWTSTCTTNGASTPISGIAVCSENGGDVRYPETELNISSDLDGNLYCWCRMVSPAVSLWVYSDGLAVTSDYCLSYCADTCADSMKNNASFRSALFGSLSD